ncbi:proteasome activator pa28, REG alpha/beta subunit [Calocera cornea HHB12733]|uniref:Proteasome activator pa28, REG alpha/beta subunit n=1 Tax=Calocera cornea HHB12733 TaxID=1353952 RepID=A0A165JT55_9BASI|nr:proteasome activator pa28, REG alpha/beta subunit [Calocera cornea HHB12733]
MVKRELSAELAEKLNAFQDGVADEAERIVWELFPQKVLDLQALVTTIATTPTHPLHASQFSRAAVVTTPSIPSSSTHAPAAGSSKKRKLENGAEANGEAHEGKVKYLESVPENKQVTGEMEALRTEFEQLVSLVDKVKLWVNLKMPKVEDGDNFGVEVQEQVLAELHRAQDSGLNLLDGLKTYHLNRAKICSKLIKYPNLPDYAEALRRHDEKAFFAIRQNLVDLRSIYCVLMDILHKNITKIRAPKGNNREALY